MAQDNWLGILKGLIFVALFLLMIASMQSVAKLVDVSPATYELAGTSRPAR